MPTLRDLVQTLVERPGVSAALVFGRDGLLVDVAGMERRRPSRSRRSPRACSPPRTRSAAPPGVARW
jgi:hypothetical protein